jgi:hypothetical protein
MNKHLLTLFVSALSLCASAQLSVPYSSTMFVSTGSGVGTADEGWISVDKDDTTSDSNKSWQYGTVTAGSFSYAPAAQITVASQYVAQTDWLISPAIHLEAGREYKLSWYDYIKNSQGITYTLTRALNVTDDELAALQADDATVTFETALASRLAESASKINKYTPTRQTLTARAETFRVDATGDYRFGFLFSEDKPSQSGSLWLVNFDIKENLLTPASVTGLTATSDSDAMTVTLNWTLPTKADTGDDLAADALTAVKVYRGDELIATLAGDATTYTDNLSAAGFYTYSVSAVCSAEGEATSVSTDYVGTIGAVELPYSTDFSDTQMTPLLWSAIDANADGKTWSYYNSYGTTYYQFENYSSSTVENDWLVSPELIFSTPGVYSLTVTGSCYSGHLTFAFSAEKSADAFAAETAFIGENAYSSYSGVAKEFEFSVPTAGNYFIGIRNDADPSTGNSYKITAFEVKYYSNIETSINSIAADAANGENVVYNLQGIRVNNPGKGLFIVNGKKTILK